MKLKRKKTETKNNRTSVTCGTILGCLIDT